jgi:hypothetical protein
VISRDRARAFRCSAPAESFAGCVETVELGGFHRSESMFGFADCQHRGVTGWIAIYCDDIEL